MNVIGIIPNLTKDVNLKYTSMIINEIIRHGGEYLVTQKIASQIGLDRGVENEEDLLKNSDIIVCLGGDGTFLSVARMAYKYDKPILGINLGTLGFLTDIEKDDYKDVALKLLTNDLDIEERMMLKAEIIKNKKVESVDIALNDVVVSRIALSRILHIKAYINDVYVDTFPGDGIIVSSPTGSTAYSLSAGGPIVEPDMNLMVVTPICPHILYSRSFITSGDRKVKISLDENYHNKAMVTVDGQKGVEVASGDEIVIGKASCTVKMVRLRKRNFFNILRSKIYYRGGL
ncbi:MAG TPA: NAD(+)/NADH kinase [Clostridiaceae bacterium]|nr:NAD(+)/NADH kinase [Clostridiaceae bacterium]